MLCGELLSGGLASAGALQAPYCGLLPGGLKNLGSPRPLTGSPYLALLVELLAAAAHESSSFDDDDDDDEDEHQTRIMMMQQQDQRDGPNNPIKMPDRSELKLQLDGEQVDEDVLLENGLLSFENPNYHLDPARLDDALNSNESSSGSSSLYDELYRELCGVHRNSSAGDQSGGSNRGVQARRAYASLDIGGMGVDVTQGPIIVKEDPANLDAADNSENHNLGYARADRAKGLAESSLSDDTLNGNPRSSRSSNSSSSSSSSSSSGSKQVQEAASRANNYCEKADSIIATTDMGGMPHVEGVNSDIYAGVTVKRRQPKDKQQISQQLQRQNNDKLLDKENDENNVDSENKEVNLPLGWEKHEDKEGPYYWHIKSGTIQREAPDVHFSKIEVRRSFIKDSDSICNFNALSGSHFGTVTRSNTSSALDQELENKRKEELALKRRSYPARADSEDRNKPIRFAVRSLGWTEIAEEDLTPERSSKAVNKCIVDLSLGRNDLLDVVGRWGDGKDLFMDLDEGALKLIDPENLTVLNTQPIHTLRVWGVGRDHGRDFAYVARDRTTRKHMCHVFRCDIPARTIANTLRDICKKIMIERSLHQNLARPVDVHGRTSLAARPTNLPTEHRRFHHRNGPAPLVQSFPTPMEEPKKILRAQYLGSMQVAQATGMDVLNDAIDQLVQSQPQSQWRSVNVAVAPSMISILTAPTTNDGNGGGNGSDKLIAECRVRYLSFLGIGQNAKQCAFIMHTAQDLFIAHVFHCEPSSGSLCKTIEAACKLRYQKCLDAHPAGFRSQSASAGSTPQTARGLSLATLKSLVGNLTGRKNNSTTSTTTMTEKPPSSSES